MHIRFLSFTFITGCILMIVLSAGSCKKNKKNKLTPVCDGSVATYDSNIKTIIDAKCVSCHSGYGSYSGISSITSNGQFKQHVLTDQDMPQNSSLNQDQINLIQCWADAGFPQN